MRRLLALAIALVACEQPTSSAPPAEQDPEPSLEDLGTVRQSEETWVMTRTGERCQVTLHVNGQLVDTDPERYACPKDLQVGEWIRITGKTCIREGGPVERKVPVVCPDYLWYAKRERAKRLDGGR
jgi:hypothetical protein